MNADEFSQGGWESPVTGEADTCESKCELL